MRENRMMPMGLNTFRLTVEPQADGTIRGWVRSPVLNREAEFTSLSRLVILLEGWLDTAPETAPCRPSAAAEPADFELDILFRQNYSWQGRLRCLKGGTEAAFRSVLELLIQLETILTQ